MRMVDQLAAAQGEHRTPRPDIWLLDAELVYRPEPAVCEIAVRVTLQRRDQLFKAVSRHRVVAGGNVDKLAPGPPDAPIPVGVYPFARRLFRDNSTIAPRQILEEGPGAIVRVVVADDKLPVAIGLSPDAFDPRFEVRPRVQIREADGNERLAH